jgi:hypothetical protein
VVHGACLKHDPEKWKPVFRKDHASLNARDVGGRYSAGMAAVPLATPLLEERVKEKGLFLNWPSDRLRLAGLRRRLLRRPGRRRRIDESRWRGGPRRGRRRLSDRGARRQIETAFAPASGERKGKNERGGKRQRNA